MELVMMRALILALLATCATAQTDTDVPFVVTPDNVTREMLKLAGVKPGDYVIDLGSGDGRIVIVAAKQFGARGLGVEIVPELVARSRDNARRAGVADRVEFRVQDLFATDLSKATVITMYLLPEVNLQLRPVLLSLEPGTRIVSHDWDMGEWRPDRTLTIPVPDKRVGLDKFSRVHLWVVPAQVNGLWCGQGRARGAALRVTQNFQRFSARLGGVAEIEGFDGHIDAAVLHAGSQGEIQMQQRGERLLMIRSEGRYAALDGVAFARTTVGDCQRKP
jgi:SAM-dependent methyltransferase